MDPNYQFRWQQFAHRLIDDLIEHPSVALPGVWELARQYKVSRPTVEHALSHLEDLGVIAPAQTGKRRQINLANLQIISSRQDRLGKRILYLSVRSDSPGHISKNVYEDFHKHCERENLYLSYIEIPSEPSAVRDLLASIRPRGVILYMAPKVVEEIVFSLNIPAIGIGPGSSLIPKFHISHAGLLAQAFQRAREAGHRRIMAPLWNVPDTYYEKVAAELEKHLCWEEPPFSRLYNLPSCQGATPQEDQAVLRELFRYTPPSCIILYGLTHYLTASSFLQENRLRIPADISIVVCFGDPLFANIYPSIAHFILFSDDMILHAFHVLQEQMNGLQSHELTELTPVWVPGGSLAAPKSR